MCFRHEIEELGDRPVGHQAGVDEEGSALDSEFSSVHGVARP